jgi:hypothetical protein
MRQRQQEQQPNTTMPHARHVNLASKSPSIDQDNGTTPKFTTFSLSPFARVDTQRVDEFFVIT